MQDYGPLPGRTTRDRRPGRFILTGSADLLRLQRTLDSLTGRAALLSLEGFSQGEHGRSDDFIGRLEGGDPDSSYESSLTPGDYAELVTLGSFPDIQGDSA